MNKLLNGTKLLTVYAPPNEFLDELDIDCLLREGNERALKKFLRSHISKRAEYSASLVLQDFVVTKHCYKVKYHRYFYHYYYYYKCSKLQIQLENDIILVGDDGVEVTLPDISASNGVIHLISEPLSVTKLDFEQLCPSPPSPSTDSPTTAASTGTEMPTPTDGEPELA